VEFLNKVKTLDEITANFHDGQVMMIGGFMSAGTPETFIDAIIEKGITNLTVIANDTGFVHSGIGKLIVNKRISRLIATHVGTNKETGRQMTAGEIEYTLVPQGTLAERIRAAGAGLGGFLTPTGVGTIVEEGKQKISVDGREYLLELPIHADIALLHAWKADTSGNLIYRIASRNFNPLMALAAELVVVSAEEIVEVGELNPDMVATPGALVDMLIKGM